MGEPKPDLSELPTRRPRWLDELPSKLIWPRGQEPDLEIGDRIVVTRHPIRYVANGRRIAEDVPGIYLEVTGIGENKRFEKVYSYRVVGDEQGWYLAQTGKGDERGYTRSPAKSIDGHAPVVLPVGDNSAISERDEKVREIRRLEAARNEMLRQLAGTRETGRMIRLTVAINQTEGKINDLREPPVATLRSAA